MGPYMALIEKTKVTLKPFKSKHHSGLKWVVYWPASEPGKPRMSRRFRTKTEAEGFRLEKEIQVTNEGRKSGAIRERVFSEAVWCVEQLEGYGVSLRDVVTDYLASHERAKNSIRIDEAIYEFYDSKKAAGKSARYLQDLRARCNRFAEEFGERTMADVDVALVEGWLESLKVAAVSRNNFRRNLGVFFSWGVKRGFCLTNPVTKAERAKEVSERVEIFTTGELRMILNEAPDDLIPFLAIGAFAGLRSEEIRRLRWESVDFLNGRIDVSAKVSKSAANRYVPIREALKSWILPVAKARGRVCTANVYKKLTAFRAQMAEGKEGERPPVEWKNNGMRHSFASYALAETDNAAQVALWLGHDSTKMIFKHYRERVTREAGAEWFAVLPSEESNILPIGKEVA